MDPRQNYSELIKTILERIASVSAGNPYPQAETVCCFDDKRGHYLLVNTGWQQKHRIRGNTLFVRLHGGKIWIEEDWTENGIADELVRRGVPKTDIVLAFQLPENRQKTDFAVA